MKCSRRTRPVFLRQGGQSPLSFWEKCYMTWIHFLKPDKKDLVVSLYTFITYTTANIYNEVVFASTGLPVYTTNWLLGCFIYILNRSNFSSFTFWSSKLASSSRSNCTDIWTGNSNGNWTYKHSTHFSTAKDVTVKATFVFM